MKKILSFFVASLLILAISNTALGQDYKNQFMIDKSSLALLNAADPAKPVVNTLSLADVNSKAIKDFRQAFKGATDERWYPSGKGFTVKFTKDGTRNSVEYDKKGHWISTVSYFDEKKMPKDLRAQVKSTYFDHKINQVIEIWIGTAHAYVVQIEDELGYKNIRIIDGAMDVLEEFSKK